MSYIRFPDLGEILQGVLLSNIRDAIRSKSFLRHQYNCNSATKVKVIFDYVGECRLCYVVYNVICKICILVYVGNTQNNIKIMEQHFQDVAQKIQHDENSDTFAAHFSQYLNPKLTPQIEIGGTKQSELTYLIIQEVRGWVLRTESHLYGESFVWGFICMGNGVYVWVINNPFRCKGFVRSRQFIHRIDNLFCNRSHLERESSVCTQNRSSVWGQVIRLFTELPFGDLRDYFSFGFFVGLALKG